jgi:hypothetical protein
MKPIVKGNWASSSTRIRMNNMNIHYEKKGCFAIGLATQFLSYNDHLQLIVFLHL